MVTSSKSFSHDLPNLAQTNGRHVCNKTEQQTTSVCFTSPRPKCNGSRCIEYFMGGTRQLCLLSNNFRSKIDTKNENLCMQNNSSSPRVARSELVLGPNRHIHKTTISPTSFGKISTSQRFHHNLPYLNLQVWHLDSRPNYLKSFQSQWQIQLRHLRDILQEESINQGGPFFDHGPRRVRWTPSNILSPQ